MAILLSARQVCKSYVLGKDNAHQALRDVSMDLDDGEFVSVMGPSGSGKSTLLYSVSGMDKITGGSVLFGGDEISSMTENELAFMRLTKMGFVFQQSNLLKNLSIFDNIVVAAYLGGREDRSAINARAERLMEQTGILYLKDNDITQASGGELQRASICRALINEPAILFGDEPTGALNSTSASEVMDIFCGVNSRGAAVMLVTHDMKVAARSDRVLYMLDGEIKGERRLGRYTPGGFQPIWRPSGENQPGENPSYMIDLKEREAGLAAWLSDMGF